MKEQLITLRDYYKGQADMHHNKGNTDARDMYDSLASDIDAQILDIMIEEQNQSVNNAKIA